MYRYLVKTNMHVFEVGGPLAGYGLVAGGSFPLRYWRRPVTK
jgi:hypothetical protein